MLFDKTKIYVRSGDGGAGMVSFRREKYVPRGGPSGGDGGRGGDVVLRVNPRLNSFVAFQKRIHFRAEHGKRGGSTNKTGASAPTLEIEVPPGTVVRDAESEVLLADLVKHGDSIVVARGGRGGRGNAHFMSSANQAPRVAEKGEPGEERWLELELKLIADVGIVGVPNAGKSTLLSVVSNAKPKIADYPFTTLEPNLGVVVYDDHDLVFADIPGLIEGAHIGVGLGHAFLRHVQRTRLLIHLLDGMSSDPLADYSQINSELALYDEKLRERPQIVVFNKIDMPQAKEQWPQVEGALLERDVQAIPISAMTQENVKLLKQRVLQVYSELPEKPIDVIETPVYELPEETLTFEVLRESDGVYRVVGKRIERAAAMTYWDYEEAIVRFHRILETLGVTTALQKAGVQEGDTVFIGDYELEWAE